MRWQVCKNINKRGCGPTQKTKRGKLKKKKWKKSDTTAAEHTDKEISWGKYAIPKGLRGFYMSKSFCENMCFGQERNAGKSDKMTRGGKKSEWIDEDRKPLTGGERERRRRRRCKDRELARKCRGSAEPKDGEIGRPIRSRVWKKEAFLWSSGSLSIQESPRSSRLFMEQIK